MLVQLAVGLGWVWRGSQVRRGVEGELKEWVGGGFLEFGFW